jgi:hypothetical protein
VADLLPYAETERSIESYRLSLANELAHICVVETAVRRSAIGYLVALISPNAVSGPEIEISSSIYVVSIEMDLVSC